jgi:branched-subunit amino acid aminotransferase/4-amino-4-deoxychorismate lyase
VGDLSVPRIEVDGRAATLETLWAATSSGYGHFTAMQVRDRAVRGLDLHLARLDEGTRALFGPGLDSDRVLGAIGHALADDVHDASVRVYVLGPGTDPGFSVMVAVREPAMMPASPQSLQSVSYQRTLPEIKHLGGFGQAYVRRLAKQAGFDEALLLGPGGVIAEGSITNIGFAQGDAVVWPDAPALHGVSMQVLERELSKAGIPWTRGPVRVDDVASFDGAFVTNARGIAPVGRIDDIVLPTDPSLVSTVMQMFAAAPWDPIPAGKSDGRTER